MTSKPEIGETMSEAETQNGHSWRLRLVVGCVIGVFLVVSLVQTELFASPSSVAAGLFGASSGNILRILQSVGVLLPLFVGLLRFTTSDRSDVSEQLNDHLLLGVLGLVFAGASAAVAGIFTSMTGILKLSLVFVLFTFVVIGLAAGAMFGEFTTGAGGDKGAPRGNGTDQETNDAKSAELEDAGDETAETEAESESESNEEDRQMEDATEEGEEL